MRLSLLALIILALGCSPKKDADTPVIFTILDAKDNMYQYAEGVIEYTPNKEDLINRHSARGNSYTQQLTEAQQSDLNARLQVLMNATSAHIPGRTPGTIAVQRSQGSDYASYIVHDQHQVVSDLKFSLNSIRDLYLQKTTKLGDVQDYTGRLISRTVFRRLNGEPSEISDFFLETGDENYFLRVYDRPELAKELRSRLNQSITVSATKYEGPWGKDATEYNRLGTYLDINKIK